jgi:hypothetical protein
LATDVAEAIADDKVDRFSGSALAFVLAQIHLAGKVFQSMLGSKLKITAATALLLAFAGVGYHQATTRAAVSVVPYDGTFRVTANDVLSGESTFVRELRIEALPGSTIEVSSDDKRVANALYAEVGGTIHPIGLSTAQLILFADQVEFKEDGANAVKFLIGYKSGTISLATSKTKAMPEGAEQLSDVLKVHVKSGVYTYGQQTRLVSFMGVTYTLVVNRTR